MVIENLVEFSKLKGQTLPPTEWLTVTQEMINSFADATLDFQWIHIDVERANKYSPFGAPVAHGFMSVSLASKFLEDTMSVKSVQMGVNYGLNKVRFPSPVKVNSRLRMHATVANIEPYTDKGAKVTWDCVIEIEGEQKPACVAQFLTLMFEG